MLLLLWLGVGLLLPVGEHFGVSLKVGGFLEGSDLANKGKMSDRLNPAAIVRVDLNKALSVFGFRL